MIDAEKTKKLPSYWHKHANLFEQTCKALRPLAAKHKVVEAFWLGGYDAPDCALYCKECAEKEFARIKKEKPDADLYLSDNSQGDGEDSEQFCEKCGEQLDEWFTEEAIEILLEVFKQEDMSPLDSPGDAWAMVRVLESLEWSDNKELVDAACVICEAVLERRK